MEGRKKTIKGDSYKRRVLEVNAVYDQHAKEGISNREIIRRYVWPRYGISEKTFYNYINALPKIIDEGKQ